MLKYFMKEALNEAQKAIEKGEIPIGAVVTRGGKIISRAHNLKEMLKDPTAHAEILAIRQAAEAVGDWRLEGCDIYVTVEPCPMCAGAIVQARIDRLVYGVMDLKAGACGSVFNIAREKRLNHQVEIISGIMEDDCRNLLKAFFKNLRI
ncbi:MAG: nucleoside deaminase [Firmicutes bacterium]|jgi:tRNA(adenine34) deaminase|nr:nucleoside deaminase [Bacillota bacterium]